MKFTTKVKRIGKYTKYITLPPKDSYKEELDEGVEVDVEIKKSGANDKN